MVAAYLLGESNVTIRGIAFDRLGHEQRLALRKERMVAAKALVKHALVEGVLIDDEQAFAGVEEEVATVEGA